MGVPENRVDKHTAWSLVRFKGTFLGKTPDFPAHCQEPFGVMADPDDDGPKYQQNWQR